MTATEDTEAPGGLWVPPSTRQVLRSGHGDAPEATGQRRVARRPVLVIGVDPGSTTGVAYVTWYPDRGWSSQMKAFQAPSDRVIELMREVIPALSIRPDLPWILATEKFVHRRRSGKLKRPTHAQIPTQLNQMVTALGEASGWKVRTRRKVDVNEWASEQRLRAAGLWEPTRGKRHARDAAQHGLYAAVFDGYAPDPLLNWCTECRAIRPSEHTH